MWLNRVIERIEQAGKLVLAPSVDGSLEFVASAMLQDNASTMWLDLQALDGSNIPARAAKLQQIRWGLPVEVELDTASRALAVHAQIVGKSVQTNFIVTGVNQLDPWIHDIISSNYTRTRIVVGCSDAVLRQLEAKFEGYTQISNSELAVTRSEAAHLLGTNVTDSEWAMILKNGEDRYPLLYRQAIEHMHNPTGASPSALNHTGLAVALTPKPRSLTQILKSNYSWLKALRVAIRAGESIDELIDRAGEEAVSEGSLASFRRTLASLPSHLREQERVLFWLLFSGSTLPKQPSVVQEVMDYLGMHEATQLRLLAASLGLVSISPEGLGAAAIDTAEPSMVLHYAHLQSIQGHPDKAVEILTPLAEQFLNTGRDFRQLQATCLLSNALISMGSLEAAAYWARLAIEAADTRVVNDKHLYATVRSLRLYTLLLLGRLDEASIYLEHDLEEKGFEGLPSMEAVFTSNADYYVLARDYDRALPFYQAVAKEFPSSVSITALPEYVRCLIELGRDAEAQAIAQEALDYWSGDKRYRVIWAALSLGMCLADTNPSLAKELFEQVISHNQSRLNAPQLMRACINMAVLELREGHDTDALRTLDQVREPLQELSELGWTFFGGTNEVVLRLRHAWLESKKLITLDFLGLSSWSVGNRQIPATRSLRFKEILLVLSMFPEGLTGEKLYEILDGKSGSTLTLRSHIRNLRQIVPVGTGPYRLVSPVKADFLDLAELLSHGELSKALELYRGPLLAESEVPYIREYGEVLESQLRFSIEQSGDTDLLTRLALLIEDDLGLLEKAIKGESRTSAAHSLLKAKAAQLRKKWDED